MGEIWVTGEKQKRITIKRLRAEGMKRIRSERMCAGGIWDIRILYELPGAN